MSGAGGIIKTYFLTGATGVVGSAIVPRLLLDPDTRVMLLIRAKDEPALQTRMGELIRFWRDSGEKVPSDRIEAVRGDATLPQFGLAEKPYSALEHECTHVIHSAGTVRMNLSLDDARRLETRLRSLEDEVGTLRQTLESLLEQLGMSQPGQPK